MFEGKHWDRVPEHVQGGLRRYVEHRIEPGGFLLAVLTNDLRESVGRADHICLPAIPDIISWLYNKAPGTCWGSPEKVTSWLQSDGQESA